MGAMPLPVGYYFPFDAIFRHIFIRIPNCGKIMERRLTLCLIPPLGVIDIRNVGPVLLMKLLFSVIGRFQLINKKGMITEGH
jgi:hypothetical protein